MHKAFEFGFLPDEADCDFHTKQYGNITVKIVHLMFGKSQEKDFISDNKVNQGGTTSEPRP